MDEQAEHEAHKTIVARADCGCLWGAHVLGHGHDADAYRDAAKWAKAGAQVETMTMAEFREVPLRCPGHPDGRWDARGRVRPLSQAGLGV